MSKRVPRSWFLFEIVALIVLANPTSRAFGAPATGLSAQGTGHGGPEPRGRVALLRDDLPVGGEGLAEGIASSPEHMAAVLRNAGFGVSLIDSGQLANGAILNHGAVDLLILPYGPSFPVAAADNLRQFLREGGKFMSVGGYAFDHLLSKVAGRWQPYQPSPPTGPSNARWRFDIPAAYLLALGHVTFSGWVRTRDVVGEQFAFMAVYEYDAGGKIVDFTDVCRIKGTTPWQHITHTFHVNPSATRVVIFAGMWECRGEAWFDEIKLLDADGRTIVAAAVRPGANVDVFRPMSWGRSEKLLCSIDPSVRHGSQPSLKVRLNYGRQGEWLNTRHGRPTDALGVEPTQLGVFDADYAIRRARSVGPAADQHIFTADWSLDPARSGKPISGYAASGVLGVNVARWRPLLNTHDRYGRPRGAAGAIIHHYAGAWKGSSWVIFGLTSHDLFSPNRPGSDAALVRLADHLVRDVYLVWVLTDKACYKQGEKVHVTASVFNGGRKGCDLAVKTSILADARSEPIYEHTDALASPPGTPSKIEFDWLPGRFDHDFYRIRADLRPASATAVSIDVLEGGFVAQQESVLAAGPKLSYRENYLHVDGQPLFMSGTDEEGDLFYLNRETPLEWRIDMEKRRDIGVTIYENLQIGLPDSAAAQDRFFNQVDALIQLAQRYAQVYFPCLLVAHEVGVNDATLRKEAEFAGAFAGRFGRTPGLIYYLNGDIGCHITRAVQPQLNEFLRARYGNDLLLQRAWGSPWVRIGRVPAEEDPEKNAPWSDVRAYDFNLFRAALIRRWHDALIDAIRKHDAVHPISSEFTSMPLWGVDVPEGIGQLSLGNIGYYDEPIRDIQRLPSVLKYSDLRSRGKSFGVGEYGAKTHPGWRNDNAQGPYKARTPEQAIELHLTVPHYTLGLGGSRAHNWSWKDSNCLISAWGMLYPCDELEKDTAYVYRNLSLLFRHLRPVYQPPSVYVMTPDTHRLGGQKMRVIEGILNSIQLLLACHIDGLGMLNEHVLAIPKEARVIFLPIPYCLSDSAYKALWDFVRGGGTLYVSGDISFDPLRRRTHTQRLTELCGVRFIRQRYPDIQYEKTPAQDLWPANRNWPVVPAGRPCLDLQPAGAVPLYRTIDGRPVVFEYRLGKGRVIFSSDPIELRTDRGNLPQHTPIYRLVLSTAGVRPAVVEPENPYIHVMGVPMRDGGKVVVFYNSDGLMLERTVRWHGAHESIKLTIKRNRPALLWFDGGGKLRAAEVQGELRIGDRLILNDGTDGIALSLDRRDLRESGAMLLMPLRRGQVRLSNRTDWRNAVVEAGEVRRGRWQSFEQQTPVKTPGGLAVDVADDQVYSLLLLSEKPQLPQWHQAVEKAMLNPSAAD